MNLSPAAVWHWIAHTDAGLAARICLGISVFIVLAWVDLRRRGAQATRWREYSFLLLAVVAAMVYGVLNDQITSRLSWEYYYYGKNLEPVLGLKTPPASGALSWEASKVGMKATWTVGLIIGVAILLANNPRKRLAQLSYRRLLRCLPMVFCSSFLFAVGLGFMGWSGRLVSVSDDFREMVRRDEFRPKWFMTVYGIHLGGYVGGVLGTIWATVFIQRARRSNCPAVRNP